MLKIMAHIITMLSYLALHSYAKKLGENKKPYDLSKRHCAFTLKALFS